MQMVLIKSLKRNLKCQALVNFTRMPASEFKIPVFHIYSLLACTLNTWKKCYVGKTQYFSRYFIRKCLQELKLKLIIKVFFKPINV